MISVRGCSIPRGVAANAIVGVETTVDAVRSTAKGIIARSRLGALN